MNATPFRNDHSCRCTDFCCRHFFTMHSHEQKKERSTNTYKTKTAEIKSMSWQSLVRLAFSFFLLFFFFLFLVHSSNDLLQVPLQSCRKLTVCNQQRSMIVIYAGSLEPINIIEDAMKTKNGKDRKIRRKRSRSRKFQTIGKQSLLWETDFCFYWMMFNWLLIDFYGKI